MEIDFLKLANEYKNEALDMLRDIVKFKTVLNEYKPESDAPFGKENKECLNWFLKKAKEDGFNTKNVFNYAGHIEYGSGSELVGVLGHLDVVPAVGNWTNDPFEAVIKDGKIFARGAADDKGPVIAAYFALKMLKDLNVKFNKRVRLIVGCDEESGSRCLHHYFKYEEMPAYGFSPDAEFPLIYGEKGFASFDVVGILDNDSIINTWESGTRINIVPDVTKVTLKNDYSKEFQEFLNKNNYNGKIENNEYIIYGKNAHGSMPALGINSNTLMVEFIHSIKPCNFTNFYLNKLAYSHDGSKLDINYNYLDMGCVSTNPGIVNIKDNNILISVDCRVPSNDNFDEIKEKLSKATSEYNLSFKMYETVKSHYVSPDSFLVKTLYNSYKEITGDNINKPFTIGGGTYAKFIPNCVAFGPIFPGEEEAIHCPDEYLIVDSFVKCIAIYAKSIYELVRE